MLFPKVTPFAFTCSFANSSVRSLPITETLVHSSPSKYTRISKAPPAVTGKLLLVSYAEPVVN